MKIRRNALVVLLTVASMACVCSAIFWKRDEDDTHSLLPYKPKTFGIFSRPDQDADKNVAPGIVTHLGNVLHGGTIGLQFETRPLKIIHGILGHAKKVIHPGGKDTVGQPNYEEPPEKDHWEEMEKPDEGYTDWEMEKPGKPEKPVGPEWEDIGEDPEGYGTDVPIEDIIQPRLRPKRFIQSKIYHVPLLYRSNGRPYLVKIRDRNGLEDDSKTPTV